MGAHLSVSVAPSATCSPDVKLGVPNRPSVSLAAGAFLSQKTALSRLNVWDPGHFNDLL